MTIVQCLETITKWLQENVCNKIKLKAAQDKDEEKFEEVNPTAFTLFQPGKTQVPPNTKILMPSVVVQLLDGNDDLTQSKARLKLQLSFMAWNPGKHKAEGASVPLEPNADGWKDVWNFVEHALQEIENAEYLNDLRVVKELGITYGLFTQDNALVDLYPYWGAWVILTIEQGLARTGASYKNLL